MGGCGGWRGEAGGGGLGGGGGFRGDAGRCSFSGRTPH